MKPARKPGAAVRIVCETANRRAASAAARIVALTGNGMNLRYAVVLFLLALMLSACGTPVPPDKAEYVGEWQEQSMYLRISQDGSVRYKRVKDGVSTSIEAPLQRLDGDNFVVGIGLMSTVFTVSRPPYHDGRAWKMVVDGVELTRTSRMPGRSEA